MASKREAKCQYCDSAKGCRCAEPVPEQTHDVCWECGKQGAPLEGRTHNGLPVVASLFVHESCGGMPFKQGR